MRRVKLAVMLAAVLAVTGGVRAALVSSAYNLAGIGTQPSQSDTRSGLRDLSPNGYAFSAWGDEALVSTNLRGSTGSLTMSQHACSGPPINAPAGAGSAGANANVSYSESFRLLSDTLAIGTPVVVNVSLSAARTAIVTTTNFLGHPRDNASVTGSAGVSFGGTGLTPVRFSGGFTGQQGFGTNSPPRFDGIFSADDSSGNAAAGNRFTSSLNLRVGDQFSINVSASLVASSGSLVITQTVADTQLSLSWSAFVAGGQARIVGDDGSVFPSSGGTPAAALEILPPRVTPEPAALSLLPLVSLGLVRRRSQGRPDQSARER